MEPQTLIWATGIVVTLIWVTTILSGIITAKYEPMQITTPVMLIYAGFLFAKGSGWGKGDKSEKPDRT